MAKNGRKWTEHKLKNGPQNGRKWATMTKNGQKWPKMGVNGPKNGRQWPKIEGCFLITQIPGTPQTTLGVHGEVGLSVGGLFLKKLLKSPKTDQNEPFWPFLPFWWPKFVLKLLFFT